MAYKKFEDGYQADFSTGRTEVDGDSVFYLTPSEASVDGQGGTIRDKPVFTIDEAAYYLNRGDGIINYEGVDYESGAEWYGATGVATNGYYNLPVSKVDSDGTLNTLSFGFYETKATLPDPYIYTRASDGTNQTYVGFAVANGFSAFDADQRAAARDAIKAWDDLIAVNFIETPFQQGDINFMNSTTGPIQASAYLPYDYGTTGIIQDDGSEVTYEEISGDVFINPNQASNHLFDEGQYGLTTLIHELGHSLGLEHPGNYNFSANFTATYVNGAEYYQDSNQYSIMSYWDAFETGAQHVDWTNLTYRYASTPGVHDVAAIQRIYGADMTTRTGDTVYGFNSNAGNDSFDFNATPAPVVTIWDAGGNDTLDLSGYNTPSVINLNAGAFSSAGGTERFLTLDEINAVRAAQGLAPRTQATLDLYNNLFKTPAGLTNGLMKDNIAIAYGATIENAVGGAGNDLIIANEVANRINGGAGTDTVSYQDAGEGVIATLALNAGLTGDAAGDRYVSIEKLEGSNFNDILTGSLRDDLGVSGLAGNDVIAGLNGNDVLDGGDGNDILDGGNDLDLLNGGAGNDTLLGGNDRDVLNGGAGDDKLDGGNDSDVLNGGAGNDTLKGGNGKDAFVFTDAGTDTIADFQKGETIDLRGLAGVDSSDVTLSKGKIFVDLAGADDLTIFVGGSAVKMSDILFAPSLSAGGSAMSNTEYALV